MSALGLQIVLNRMQTAAGSVAQDQATCLAWFLRYHLGFQDSPRVASLDMRGAQVRDSFVLLDHSADKQESLLMHHKARRLIQSWI